MFGLGNVGSLGRVGQGSVPAPLTPPGGPPADIDLNFAAGYSYVNGAFNPSSVAPLTVARASNGYAADNAGNWFLFGNNVARRTTQGLLVEESRTNLALNSAAPISANGWTFVACTT